eukprot:7246149-Pyramimonas_sp.AAC.1
MQGRRGTSWQTGGPRAWLLARLGQAMQLRTPTFNGAVGVGRREPHMHVDGIPITRAKKQLRDR